MKNKVAMLLGAIAVLALLASVYVFWVIQNPGHGEVPMTPVSPTTLVTPSPSASVPPEPTPTSIPTPTPTVPSMNDIDGIPVHITIRSGSTIWADTSVVTMGLDDAGMLVPPTGQAGVYYSQQQWATIPGNMDTYRGIIVGHDVTGTGAKDVFYDLGQVKQGDTIIVTYQLNAGGTATAEFVAIGNARSAPKTDVIHAAEYQYLWGSASEPGRYLSILSCDLSQAAPGQHSRNNWIVDTVRTK